MPGMLSPLSRIVGIDDSPFRNLGASARVLVVGVLMRGASHVDGIVSTRVVRDGFGATRAIAAMLTTGRLAGQAQVVLLDGVAVAGFNIVDLQGLHRAVGVPVIAVMRRMPDVEAVRKALERTKSPARRWRLIERAGPIHRGRGLWFQVQGATPLDAAQMLGIASGDARYPEALRLAHLVGGGVVLGASRGGA